MKLYFEEVMNFYSKELSEIDMEINSHKNAYAGFYHSKSFETINLHFGNYLNKYKKKPTIYYEASRAFGDISIYFDYQDEKKNIQLAQVDYKMTIPEKDNDKYIFAEPVLIYLTEKNADNLIEKKLAFSKEHNTFNFKKIDNDDQDIISNFSIGGHHYTNAYRRPESDVVNFFNLIHSLSKYNIEEAESIIFNSTKLQHTDIDKLKLIYDLDFSKIENSQYYVYDLESFLKQKTIRQLKI